ncbi:unnamed protein product [Effrenium voratum]|nr:unnamed protein product [Effrenium voratum]
MSGLCCSRCGINTVDMIKWDDQQSAFVWIGSNLDVANNCVVPGSYQAAHWDPREETNKAYCSGCWDCWGTYVRSGNKAYILSKCCEALACAAGVVVSGQRCGNPFQCVQCNKCFNKGTLEKHLQKYHAQSSWKEPWHSWGPDCYGCLASREVSMQTNFTWVTDEYHSKGFWEFLAKGPGGGEDWQPFRQNVQEVLEARFKSLQSEGGPSEVSVPTNGYSYIIDLEAMTQRNQNTNRMRRIRRQEIKQASGPQLLEHEAGIDSGSNSWRQNPNRGDLCSERDALVVERNDLLADRVQLRADCAELQRQNGDLLSQSAHMTAHMERDLSHQREVVNALNLQVAELQRQLSAPRADHRKQMAVQESWRMGAQLNLAIVHGLPVQDMVNQRIQEALRATCPAGHHSQCAHMRNATVVSVEQLHNVNLWKSYEFRKEQIRRELTASLPQSHIMESNTQLSGACSWAKLDASINEMLVLHGTALQNLDKIAQFGFDERLAREGGLFGQGIYFTDESCKSAQYSGAYCRHSGVTEEVGCIIIARLVLGYPYFATGPLKQLKTEPLRDEANVSQGHCHCVVARSGTPNGQGGGAKQVHKEFVVFNRYQAYPELVVRFKVQ